MMGGHGRHTGPSRGVTEEEYLRRRGWMPVAEPQRRWVDPIKMPSKNSALPFQDALKRQLMRDSKKLDTMMEDLHLAAGELRLAMPEPGTDLARSMTANQLLKADNRLLGGEIARLRQQLTKILDAAESPKDSADCEDFYCTRVEAVLNEIRAEHYKVKAPGGKATGYICQFCGVQSSAREWKGEGGTECPKCGRQYDYLMAQDSEE